MGEERNLHRSAIWLWLVLIMVFGAQPVGGLTLRDRFHSLITKGNRLYAKGENQKALENYLIAKSVDSTSVIPGFNAGDALYKMGRFDESLREFSSAVVGRSDSTTAMAYYNIGNAFFKLRDLRSAVEAYKRALLIKPDDEDAKYNLELALRLLKEQENQNSKQCEQDNQGRGQEEQDQERKRNEPSEGSNTNPQDQAGQEEKQISPMGSIDLSELERILAAIDASDREVQKDLIKKRSSVKRVVGKDW